MSIFGLVLIYLGMVVFDVIILGGAVYLIEWKGWSGWWILVAVIIASGSNPRKMILAWQGKDCEITKGEAP